MPTADPASPVRRRRGRPPKAEGLDTARRLVEAAASVCAERGLDGCTLALVAERAGVRPTAVYNHFSSREELLYATAVRALDQITAVALDSSDRSPTLQAVAAAYLRPDMREPRRIIAEIHLASARDERLADLLAAWHRRWADRLAAVLPPTDPDPHATVKSLFLLLLGVCHLDDLRGVRASRDAVAERVEEMVAHLVPGGAGDRPTTSDRRR